MVKRLFIEWVILLCFAIQNTDAQCPPSSAVVTRLNEIVGSQMLRDNEKIRDLQVLQKAYLLCTKERDSIYARIAHRIGAFYNKIGDNLKAISYTKEAVAINSSNLSKAERPFLSNSYYNLGYYYSLLYLFDESYKYLDSCIYVSLQYHDKEDIALDAFALKASIYNENGDYEKSIEATDNGITLAKKSKGSFYEGSLLSQKAQSLLSLNKVPEAEINIKQAAKIFEANKQATDRLASVYSVYAYLLGKKKDYNKAVTFYKKSIQLSSERQDTLECSRNILNLGLLFEKELNDWSGALKLYNQGLKLIERNKDPYQQSGFYINIGVVYWRQHNYKAALQYYQKALNILPINFTDTAIKNNPSTDMLKRVVIDYFVFTLLSNKGEALLDLFQKENNREFLNVALNTFSAADKTVDLMRWKQYGDQSKLFWREKTKKMYEKAIETCYLLKDTEKAYYFFEKSRAVLLNDKLSELGARKYISDRDRLQEQQLRANILSLNQSLSSVAINSTSYISLKQQLILAQNKFENFLKNLEAKYPVYYQYKYDNVIYPFVSLQKQLSSNKQSLIEYFTADSTIYVLCVFQGKSTISKIHYSDYDSKAKEFLKMSSNPSQLNQYFSRYSSLAFELYSKIFKPLNIPDGRVIVSPDDYFIPFDALLYNEKDRSSFLLKKYAFDYAYSMRLLTKINTAKKGSSFLGIAPINYKSYLNQSPLQGSDASLNNIKPYFQSANFLIGEQASKQQFLKSIASFNIIQVYSHADADTGNTPPMLYLNDSILNVSEIEMPTNIKTNMIVLSACKTANGKYAKGEGIFSMARAFMAAGIPSIVTTLWQVDNKASYELTELFYKRLNQGLTKDVALQKAKLDFLNSDDKMHELPYYWAPFIVLGNTDVVMQPANSGFQDFYRTSLLVILAIILALVFRKFFPGRQSS
jgi:CHAT domain-containing protein/tetratricopeptide (TPR) repeat protein